MEDTTEDDFAERSQDGDPEEDPSELESRFLKSSMAAYRNAQEEKEEEENLGQESETKDNETKKKAGKAIIRRGGIFGANTIAGALDSTGVDFILSFFVHAASLLELVVGEMIYGRHIAKGKSKIFPPISWEPIPLLPSIDPKAIILQGFLIAAVFAFALMTIALGAGGLCFLYDYVKFITSPIQTGVHIVAGGNGMCLGGIISTLFGL